MTSPQTSQPGSASASGQMPPTFPELYERHLVDPLFRPMATELIGRANLRDNGRLLDVACGTGIVSRIAKEQLPSLHTTGIDRNPEMLGVARAKDRTTDWREGDAGALPFPDASFDSVICHQGLQFFPDKPAAVAEFHRVLVPGGTVVVGVWRSLDDNGLFGDLGRTAERILGPIRDARHAFHDPGALDDLLVNAGFRDVRVEPVTCTITFADGAALVRLNTAAVIGMTDRGKSLSDDERAKTMQEIIDASAPDVARYASPGGVTFNISANVASAKR